jgi:PhnB protein
VQTHDRLRVQMKLSPHLTFDGQYEAAFKFYERCLGGTIIVMLSYGESPMANQVPPEWAAKILHATLSVGENTLVGADSFPGRYEQPRGFHVVLGIADLTEAERAYHALTENGTVQMPLQETFWAVRFGVLVDQFGISWEINCEPAR